ncbi:MAG: hypothetical protein IKX26_08780 [Bacteroidales bacterium]|nr:hypothetical protein [Bacteroidales bacterium]
MTRTIHPVGQGAFYSETFRDSETDRQLLTAVYDCGADNKNAKERNKQIKDFGKPVNLLFVSHFHKDHTNGILDLLRAQHELCKIVIPGVTHCRFIIDLVSGYLISSPSVKFMLSCIPALKKPWTRAGTVSAEDNFPGVICKHPTSSKTYSVMALSPTIGCHVRISSPSIHWYYDADYTEIDPSKEKQLIIDLSDIIPSLKTILPDIEEYRDSDWYEKYFLPEITKEKLDEIGKVFTKVFGASHHNSYSMLVHSHPGPGITDKEMDCLYTGDIEIDNDLKNKIINCHPHYIQVPHHGSIKNHVKGIYFRRQIAFISVGTNNTFGHPDKTILMDLIHTCPYIHIITEDKQTEFKRSFTI